MSTTPQTPWHQEQQDEWLAKAITDTVAALEKLNGEARAETACKHMRMYSGRSMQGLGLSNYFRIQRVSPFSTDTQKRLRWNVIQVVVDTLLARLGTNRPAPLFLTEDGDYSLKTRAKRLAQFVKGVFYTENAYELGPMLLLYSIVTGTGVCKTYLEGDRVCYELVFPWELHVDPREALYGEPRNLFQTRDVDRRALITRFPDMEHQINMSQSREEREDEGIDEDTSTADTVRVYEAWYLPDSIADEDGAISYQGGRHTLAVSEGVLWDEDYNKPHFPFVFLHWKRPMIGFWGQGLVEELAPVQREINYLLKSIQQNIHLGSHPMVLKERGSKVEDAHLNNNKFNIVNYTNAPPQIVTFQTTHPEVFNYLETQYNRAFEIARLSRLSAHGEVPAGVQGGSGRAMLVYNDIESAGFKLIARQYEQCFMDLAKQTIELAKEAYEDGVDIEITGQLQRRRETFLRKVKWSEVDLEDSAYEMKVMPVSDMPDRPEGKIKYIEQLTGIFAQSGTQIDPAVIAQMLDFPDVESWLSMVTAPSNSIFDAIETMLEDGEYIAPEPFDDPMMAARYANFAYKKAKLDGVPEERLQLLRDYIQASEQFARAAMPPPPAAPAPGGGVPPAPPGVPA